MSRLNLFLLINKLDKTDCNNASKLFSTIEFIDAYVNYRTFAAEFAENLLGESTQKYECFHVTCFSKQITNKFIL